MFRLSNLVALLVFACPVLAQAPAAKTGGAVVQKAGPSEGAPKENPWDIPSRNAPCSGQARSFAELAAAFQRGRFPLVSQVSGTWVQIGSIYARPEFKHRNLDCSGEKFRDGKFVSVVTTNGTRVEMNFGGDIQTDELKANHKGSVEFSRDLYGDEGEEDTYRCRLTKRGTLVCLLDPKAGVEFKKMKVDKSQLEDPSSSN